MCDVHVLCESSRLHKPSKLLQKASKRLQKTIKCLQIPKTRSLCFLNALDNMTTKIGQFEHSAFFCMVLTELSLWKKHGYDGKFEHCACVCAHHHADGGARLILWETIWNSRFFLWSNSIINAGGREVTENSRLQWRAWSSRPVFGDIDQNVYFLN